MHVSKCMPGHVTNGMYFGSDRFLQEFIRYYMSENVSSKRASDICRGLTQSRVIPYIVEGWHKTLVLSPFTLGKAEQLNSGLFERLSFGTKRHGGDNNEMRIERTKWPREWHTDLKETKGDFHTHHV